MGDVLGWFKKKAAGLKDAAVREAVQAAIADGMSPTEAADLLAKDPWAFVDKYALSVRRDVQTAPARFANRTAKTAATVSLGAGFLLGHPLFHAMASEEFAKQLENDPKLRQEGEQILKTQGKDALRTWISANHGAKIGERFKTTDEYLQKEALGWGGRYEEPVTLPGKGVDIGLDAALATGEGKLALAGADNRLGQAVRLGVSFGLKDLASANAEATRMGLEGWRRKAYLATRAASGAGMAFAPTELFEGVVAKVAQKMGISNEAAETILKKSLASLADAEIQTVLGNASARVAGDNRSITDQRDLFSNLLSTLAIKTYAQGHQVKSELMKELSGGVETPRFRQQSNDPTMFERRLFASEEGHKADMMQAMEATKRLKAKYGEGVSTELFHYLDAKQAVASGARVEVPELSRQAKVALADPLFKGLRDRAAEAVNLKRNVMGKTDEGAMVSPEDYVHRIAVETGGEPSGVGGFTPAMRTNASGNKERAVGAFQDHEGGRTVVYGNGNTLLDAATGKPLARRMTVAEAMAQDLKDSLRLNMQLAERSGRNVDGGVANLLKNIEAQEARVNKLADDHDVAVAQGSENLNEVSANLDAERVRLATLLEQADGYREYTSKRFGQDQGAWSQMDPESSDTFNKLAEINDRINYTRDNLGLSKDPNWKSKRVYKSSNGDIGQLTEATAKEIEGQTPIRYKPDAFGSSGINMVETGIAARNTQTLYGLRDTPLAPKDPGGELPRGFTRLGSEYPMFEGYLVDERVAKALKNLADRKIEPGDLGKVLRSANTGIVSAMFGNPLVHAKNPIQHFLEGVGAKGWLTDGKGILGDLERAQAIVDSVKAGQPNADAVELMRHGVKFMSAGDVTGDYRKFAAEFGGLSHQLPPDDNGGTRGQAFPVPEGTIKGAPAKAANAVLDASNEANRNSIWTMDDLFRTATVLRNMRKGMDTPDAVNKARETYAFYQRSANPLDQQSGAPGWMRNAFNRVENALRATKEGRDLTVFGGYGQDADTITARKGAGLLAPLTEGNTPQAREKAGASLDKIAATLGAGYLVKQAGSALMQGLANREDMKFEPGGTWHRAGKAAEAAGGVLSLDPQQAIRAGSSLVVPSPAVSVPMVAANSALKGTMLNPSDLADRNEGVQRIIQGDVDTGLKMFGRGQLQTGQQGLNALAGGLSMSYAPYFDTAEGTRSGGDLLAKMMTGTTDTTDAEKQLNALLAARRPAAPQSAWDEENSDEMKRFRLAIREGRDDDAAAMIPSIGIDRAIKTMTEPGLDRLANFRNKVRALRLTGVNGPHDLAGVYNLASQDEKSAIPMEWLKAVEGTMPKDNQTPQDVNRNAESRQRLLNPLGDIKKPVSQQPVSEDVLLGKPKAQVVSESYLLAPKPKAVVSEQDLLGNQ